MARKLMELSTEDSSAVGKLMNQLSDKLDVICDGKAVAFVIVQKSTGLTTLCIAPPLLLDPETCKALLDGIRNACDIYEKDFVKAKLQ